jgi:predicted CXXCH cytochrome family protein
MKKIILTVAAVALTATSAFAFTNTPATTVGITGTGHDLSAKANTANTQKCIFAHTPHNAYRNVPLWNRYDGQAVVLYNSPSLTAEARRVGGTSLNKDSISAMCMSCHDGVSAMGNIKNTAQTNLKDAMDHNNTKGQLAAGTVQNVLANLGQDMTNDHPVGFSYKKAYEEDTAVTIANARLHSMAEVKASFKTINAPFYNVGTDTDQMECASCHAAHDNRNRPFLRMTNAASALCLACHVK